MKKDKRIRGEELPIIVVQPKDRVGVCVCGNCCGHCCNG
jgi:hypothetical protein